MKKVTLFALFAIGAFTLFAQEKYTAVNDEKSIETLRAELSLYYQLISCSCDETAEVQYEVGEHTFLCPGTNCTMTIDDNEEPQDYITRSAAFTDLVLSKELGENEKITKFEEFSDGETILICLTLQNENGDNIHRAYKSL